MNEEDSYNLRLIRTRLGWVCFWLMCIVFGRWIWAIPMGVIAGVLVGVQG